MFWLSMLGLSLMVCRGFLFVCCFCNYAVGKTCRLTFQWADQAHHLQRSPVWTRAVQATFGSLLSGDCTTWLPFHIRFRSFRKKAARAEWAVRIPSYRVSPCPIVSDRQDNLLVSSIYLLKIHFATVMVRRLLRRIFKITYCLISSFLEIDFEIKTNAKKSRRSTSPRSFFKWVKFLN